MRRKMTMLEIVCLVGAVVSSFGTMAVFGIFFAANCGPVNLTELPALIFFAAPVFFVFLLAGAPLIGYEGTGTPLNVALNVGFYAFLALSVLFFAATAGIHLAENRKKGGKSVDKIVF